jgi:protoheme IX farnesyltransferase
MWTPPHFWALSLYRAGDYEKAGVPMLPVVAGEAETRNQILIYTILLVPLTLLPSLMGFAGWAYTGAAVVLGLTFFILALGVWMGGRAAGDDRRKQTGVKHQARRLFAFSIF